MLEDFLSDLTTRVLAKSLDCCSLRQRVIANNIANVETPGFKRSEVRFGEKLREILANSSEKSAESQIRDLQPVVTLDEESPSRPNGNNVSVEKEMVDMVENSIQYEAFVQLLNLKSGMVRAALSDGRRY